MSDIARKDISSKVSETVTPDSSKSTTQKAKEVVTGKADHAAAHAEPNHDKSITQAAVDSTHSHTDNTTHDKGIMQGAADSTHAHTDNTTHDKGIVEKVKDTVGMGSTTDSTKHT